MADGGEDTREPDTSPGLGDLLDVFLAQLQEDGLTIGARERVAAHAVTARWLQDRPAVPERAAPAGLDSAELLRELGPLLAPVLARSREERARFFEILRRLSPNLVLAAHGTDGKDTETDSRRDLRSGKRGVWAILAAALLVAALIWVAVAQPWKPAEVQVAPVINTDGSTGASRIERVAPTAIENDTPVLQTADRWLGRVLAAAEQHDYAPTLEEVAAGVMLDPEHEAAGFAEASVPAVVLGGHTGTVLGAVFSADESRVLTWSKDQTARLWNAATGAAVRTLEGHEGDVFNAAFSPDASLILTGSGDGTARLWDAADGAALIVLKGHTGAVYGAAFSPDGARIVTGSWDGTARLWDAADGAALIVLKGHTGAVYGGDFSPDGARIVTGSEDGTARLWDTATAKQIGPALQHDGSVFGAAFSPDGTRVLTWSGDGSARLWDADSGVQIAPALRHDEAVYGAAFSPNGSRILTWSRDNTARLWVAATGAQMGFFHHEKSVNGAAFSKDEALILTWDMAGTVRQWDGASGEQIGSALSLDDVVSSAAYSQDGSRILAASGNVATIWDIKAGFSPITWNPPSLAQRLHELTGLPANGPLDLFRPEVNDPSGWARLALALARIEAPDAAPSLAELSAAARRAFETASVDGAPALIAPLTAIAAEDAPPADIGLLIDRLSADPAIGGASAGAVNRALAILGDERLPAPGQVWKAPPPHPASSVAPAWLRWLAAAVPLGFLFWFFTKYALRRPFLRRRQPRVPPLHTDLISDAGRRVAFDAGLFQRAGQRLLSRTPQASATLDIRETLSATLREGGVFITPVYASTRARPEYLILIERASASDHEALRLRQLIERLKGLVDYDIWYFQTEPGELESDDRARRITIEQAQTRFPEHRLIILGTGEGFLDPVSFEPRPVAQKLRFWARRALLTPVALADWSREEYALAEGLSMPIGRATPEGLLTLSDLLGLDGVDSAARLNPKGDGLARPLPDIFRGGGQRFLYPSAPDELTLRRLIRELRGGLDAQGFEWLAALGVYPAIQWDLTLYLGVELARLPGGDPVRDPIYDEARLANLSQLPWLKAGQMPNWLRRALIAELSPVRREEVRQVIARAIEAARPQDRAEEEKLRLRIGREAPKEALPPERLFDDEVLLDFLMARNEEDFPLARLTRLNQIFERSFWEQFGAPEWLTASAAIAFAAAAFAVAPVQGQGPLVTGAFVPLLLLAIGALSAASLWNPKASLARLMWISERAAPVGPVFALATAFVFAARIVDQRAPQVVAALGDYAGLFFGGPPWLTLFVAVCIGIMIFRGLGERLGFNIFVSPLGSFATWRDFFLKSLALTVLFPIFAILSSDLATFVLGRSSAFYQVGLLLAPWTLLTLLGLLSSHAGLAPAKGRASAPASRENSRWPQLARFGLAAAPVAAAVLVAAQINLTHTVRDLGLSPAEVVTSVDGTLLLSISASGDFTVLTADGDPIGSPLRRATGQPVASAIGGTAQAPRLAWADASGKVFLREPGGPVQPVVDPLTGLQLESRASPPRLGFGPDGRLFVATETEGAASVLAAGKSVRLNPEFGPVSALLALEPGLAAVATLDGSVHVIDAGGARVAPTVRTAAQPSEPASAARQLLPGLTPGTFRMLATDGRLWTVRYGAGEELEMEDAGILAALALGPPVRRDKSGPAKPRDWPNFTEDSLLFSYLPPGELFEGSGTGVTSAINHAPDMEFPISNWPSYLQSHVYSPGGGIGGGNQCDPGNFAYPWQDMFCERRSSQSGPSECATRQAATIVRIRAGSAELCRQLVQLPAAERRLVDVVAAEAGVISEIGAYTLTLLAGDRRYRYMHLNMQALEVSVGDEVSKAQRLGFLSNDFGGTPTTLGIAFGIDVNQPRQGWVAVSPYTALVEAYDRKLARVARDKGLSYQSPIGGEDRPEPQQALPEVSRTAYIQIASEAQRAEADRLQQQLRTLGVTVPGIELRAAESPSQNEVRYFSEADLELANSIASTAKRAGLRDVQVLRGRATSSRAAPPEFWFARVAAPSSDDLNNQLQDSARRVMTKTAYKARLPTLFESLPGARSFEIIQQGTEGLYAEALAANYDVLAEYEINTPLRVSGFLGQAMVETGWFKYTQERFNYSEEALVKTFRIYRANPELASQHAQNEELIANTVYGGRADLGNTEPGDGWKFRGRGMYQIVGRASYERASLLLGIDLVSDPDILNRDLSVSVKLAAAIWDSYNLNEFSDRNETYKISRAINRGNPDDAAAANHEDLRILWSGTALSIMLGERPGTDQIAPGYPD
jgi:WD40 repeat protein/predicted chitinase